MPASMLDSQMETLETLAHDENGIALENVGVPETVARRAAELLPGLNPTVRPGRDS